MFHMRDRYHEQSGEEEPEDPLAKLTESQGDWRVSTMSALYELKYNTVKLKQYASKIKQILSCSLAENRSIKYNVTVERETALRKNESDPCALTIIVRTITGKGPEITSYVAVLMSWGAYKEVPLGTHLPYLLERGRQHIGDIVKTMLTKLFDCYITAVQFTKEQMILLTLYLCQKYPSDSQDVKLVYKPMELCKDKITLAIKMPALMTIYDSIVIRLEDATREEVAEGVCVGLQRHMFHNANMDFSMMELCKSSHPRASVACAGSISAKSPDILTFMLQYFNETLLRRVQ